VIGFTSLPVGNFLYLSIVRMVLTFS